MTDSARPLVSLVAACYGVAEYLPDFIQSVEPQLNDAIEVILVIDGSPDNSAEIAYEWARSTRHRVMVIEQENQGVCGARNAGLRVARGEWISFPDPDDILDSGYLARVVKSLRSAAVQSGQVSLVSTNVIPFMGVVDSIVDNHPLRIKYASGERVVRLSEDPTALQLATHSAFLRVERLRRHKLTFDDRVRPVFEDAHLVSRYLLTYSDPAIALLPRARYLYRRRADNSSLIATVWSKPEKYDDVLRYGHLALLDAASSRGGVPLWLQNTILYDIIWYFKADQRAQSETAGLTDEQKKTFNALLSRVLTHIPSSTIAAFGVTGVPCDVRAALLAQVDGLPARPAYDVAKVDRVQGLAKVTFYTTESGVGPGDISYIVDGVQVEPCYTKRRSLVYFGRTYAQEAIAWVPAGDRFTLLLNGTELRAGQTPKTQSASRQAALREATSNALGYVLHDRAKLRWILRRLAYRQVREPLARLMRNVLPDRHRQFRDCWLLMDRDASAGDNAEHLYRYLREHRPDVNAWFVLRDDSADWDRLVADGFRLVSFGSRKHTAALLRSRELLSSHIDNYVVNPPTVRFLKTRPWRFTWLQHGVTQQDLSRWLGSKEVTTVVAATPQEEQAFVADGSAYPWTGREVVLTGFPRHDALVAKAAKTPVAERRLLVFMPTWRRDLLTEAHAEGNARGLGPTFWESDYAANWFGLINSDRVRDAAMSAGLTVVLMAHPNLAPHVGREHVGGHVRLARYEKDDVQVVLARAAHVVSDYSSVVFDAALIERSILYFQFDRESFFGGGHIGRPGYFDYVRDGFGPVAESLAEAEDTLVSMIETGATIAEPYRARARSTFTVRDGSACARVADAVLQHSSRYEASVWKGGRP